MLCKKGFLRNFAKFTGSTCVRVFLNKVTGLKPATFFKKRLWHRCFPVNFVKFLRTPFLTEHLRWLLLKKQISAKRFHQQYHFCFHLESCYQETLIVKYLSHSTFILSTMYYHYLLSTVYYFQSVNTQYEYLCHIYWYLLNLLPKYLSKTCG